MLNMIFKRILQAIPMIIVISIVSFILIRMAPGDPVTAHITPEASIQDIEKIRESMGLNDSYIVQYFRWAKAILRGDFGYSFSNHQLVLKQITERLPATFLLMGTSMLISIILGVIIGVISAMNKNGIFDKIFILLSYIGISIPSFWFGMMLLQLFALKLNILPSVGMRTVGVNSFSDLLKHLIMPVITLSIADTSVISRYVRARVIEQMDQDYVLTEIAYGASKNEVFFKSILKNAILPLITIIGMSLPALISGAFVTESIFGWPGLGQLGMKSIFAYDYPMIMATTMFASILLIVGNLISDILYMIVDPRIKELN